ncbi:MAG: ribonuclease T2 [Anaerolineae bacterium]|nr:ribonuclease T2 [Anaerolineae bacterium]
MTKKRSSSQGNSLPFDLKKGGVLVLILALLVLGANAILSKQGAPLPTDIVEQAENLIEEALTTDEQAATEASGENNAPETQRPTRTPKPPTTVAATRPSDTSDMPWLGAEGDFDYYVLALSWEPAFCETKPDKEECETQTTGRYDAANFVLHGLWPNLKGDNQHTFGFCDVPKSVIRQDEAGDWCDMPEVEMSDSVWQDLTRLMPGTASCLQNHEWYKHGTCAGMPADAYFALANELATLFAESDFNNYVAGQVGDEVNRRDLLNRFDDEFGPGASDNLSLRCTKVGGTSLLSEIQIALRPDLAEIETWEELFPGEKTPTQGNCPQTFKVDRVGAGDY